MKRAVFYARVSKDSKVQLHSLNAQRDYFKKYINEQEDMIFSGEYYDEGISGTALNKRNSFNKMIVDALNHKFDLILVKDISRFSRNTLDTIEKVRLLKSHGIDVIFTNDHIDTSSSDGELNLTLIATMAQEESRKISERIKWTMSKEMKNGRMFITSIYGYDVVDGKLVINEKEAEVVRLIFKLYLDGLGYRSIIRQLQNMNIRTHRGREIWDLRTLYGMLRNEKYAGNLVTHKVQSENYLTHKQIPVDESERHYFYDTHEAIIDKETFERVQAELKRRKCITSPKKKTFLTGRLQCGYCGGSMNIFHGMKESNYYYYCRNNMNYKNCDNTKYVNIRHLRDMIRVVIKDVFLDSNKVHSKVVKAIKKSTSYSLLHQEKVYCEKRLKTIKTKKDELVEYLLSDNADLTSYHAKMSKLEEEEKIINDKLDKLNKDDQKDTYYKSVEGISDMIENKLNDDQFIEYIITLFIDKIVYRNRNDFDLYINTNQYKYKEFDSSLYKYIVTLHYDFSYLEIKYSIYKNYNDTNIGIYMMGD